MFWDDEEGEKFLKSDGSPHFGFQFFLAREFRFPRPKPVVNPPWEMMTLGFPYQVQGGIAMMKRLIETVKVLGAVIVMVIAILFGKDVETDW